MSVKFALSSMKNLPHHGVIWNITPPSYAPPNIVVP